jgi:hypothetical protein
MRRRERLSESKRLEEAVGAHPIGNRGEAKKQKASERHRLEAFHET